MDVINYARSSHVCAATKHMGGGFFSKWGAQVHVKKTIENFFGFELAIVRSQALQYNVITYKQYEL